jgi:Protein of unknown function (DUF3102)
MGDHTVSPDDALAASNSLADLAARIKAEHRAASDKMSEALLHAMAAGDLLIEAKALVQHGQWLPWLTDHVAISERTAQIYMRVAKNRAEIEASKAQSAADLSLGEAVALLALSSDARKLLAFMKECEGLEGEELVQACLDAGVALIHTPNYDRFAGRSDEERREWLLYALMMAKAGHSLDWVSSHLDWQLRGPWNPTQWLGEEGDAWRRRYGWRPASKAVKAGWSRFAADHRLLTEAEIKAEIEAAQNNAPQRRSRRKKPRPHPPPEMRRAAATNSGPGHEDGRDDQDRRQQEARRPEGGGA